MVTYTVTIQELTSPEVFIYKNMVMVTKQLAENITLKAYNQLFIS
jgi:hypothetical protein